MKIAKRKYNQLIKNIGITIDHARKHAVKAINIFLLKGNWEIGRHIVEFEQEGSERAGYGSDLLEQLSRDLQQNYGKGSGRRNVLNMRRFYLAYQKWQAVPAKLGWTHIVTLLSVTN